MQLSEGKKGWLFLMEKDSLISDFPLSPFKGVATASLWHQNMQKLQRE